MNGTGQIYFDNQQPISKPPSNGQISDPVEEGQQEAIKEEAKKVEMDYQKLDNLINTAQQTLLQISTVRLEASSDFFKKVDRMK